jgi:phosphonate transport system substrate-binding protein
LIVKNTPIFSIIISILVLFSTGTAQGINGNAEITMGGVSHHPQKYFHGFKVIAGYVNAQLSGGDPEKAPLFFPEKSEDLLKALKEKNVDWAIENPFLALTYIKKNGAELLMRRWKNGSPDCSSLFFSRSANPIKNFNQLKGKKIALGGDDPLTGFYLPLAYLRQQGLTVVKLGSLRDNPLPGQVGYVESDSVQNTVAWVSLNLVDAGALSDEAWESEEVVSMKIKPTLDIFFQSPDMIASVVVVRKGLAEEIKKGLTEVLLTAPDTTIGAAALEALDHTTKFDLFTPKLKKKMDVLQSLVVFITPSELGIK